MKQQLAFERVALHTPLRGNRNYVHSTSIYNQLLTHAENVFEENAWVRQLKLSQFFDTQCYATITLDENDHEVGSFSLQCVDELMDGYIVTDKQLMISSREKFDEDSICSNATVHGQGIDNEWQKNTPFIDQCVALTKHFHNDLYPLEDKKWIYTRLTMKEDIAVLNPENISIKLNRKLGDRMTRSNIFLDGKEFGVIEFSVN